MQLLYCGCWRVLTNTSLNCIDIILSSRECNSCVALIDVALRYMWSLISDVACLSFLQSIMYPPGLVRIMSLWGVYTRFIYMCFHTICWNLKSIFNHLYWKSLKCNLSHIFSGALMRKNECGVVLTRSLINLCGRLFL